MKNIPLLIGTILGTILLIIGAVFVLSSPQNSTDKELDQAVLLDGVRHFKGAENPKITIVEFSDLQCPACRVAQPLVDQLITEYGDQVRVAFRHFPLITIHEYALVAAQASEVAAESGKFWEFNNLLFEKQAEWSILKSKDEVINMFGTYFDQLEIDKTNLAQKIETTDIKQRVNQDSALAESLRVGGTPTFFVNGHQTAAPQLLSTVESQLKSIQ